MDSIYRITRRLSDAGLIVKDKVVNAMRTRLTQQEEYLALELARYLDQGNAAESTVDNPELEDLLRTFALLKKREPQLEAMDEENLALALEEMEYPPTPRRGDRMTVLTPGERQIIGRRAGHSAPPIGRVSRFNSMWHDTGRLALCKAADSILYSLSMSGKVTHYIPDDATSIWIKAAQCIERLRVIHTPIPHAMAFNIIQCNAFGVNTKQFENNPTFFHQLFERDIKPTAYKINIHDIELDSEECNAMYGEDHI